jgi:hypothetical protein
MRSSTPAITLADLMNARGRPAARVSMTSRTVRSTSPTPRFHLHYRAIITSVHETKWSSRGRWHVAARSPSWKWCLSYAQDIPVAVIAFYSQCCLREKCSAR